MADTVLELPPTRRGRRRELVFGTALATSGVVMLMLTLSAPTSPPATRRADTWLAANAIPLTQPNVQMVGLALSVVTMQWAVYSIEHDDRIEHPCWLWACPLLFGAAFVNQTVFLCKFVAITADQPEGSLFYAVTGGHVAMIRSSPW